MHEEHHSFLEIFHEVAEELKANLGFVTVALIIMALILGLTVLAEKTVIKKEARLKMQTGAKRIAGIGIFSAIGGVLTLIEIPMFVFYNLDFSEIPALFAGLFMGPVAGAIVEFIKIFVHILFHGTHSAFVGEFAMFVTGCLLVVPASVFYWKNKTRKNAFIGLLIGFLSFVIIGAFFNGFYLIPKFAELYGMPIEALVAALRDSIFGNAIQSLWGIVAFATVPFNFLKGLIVCAVVFLIYKPLATVFHKI